MQLVEDFGLGMKYQLLPPLTTEEYEALKEDIQARGIMHPVELDENGDILDGHHRAQICQELGIDCPTIVRDGMTEEEKRTHARSMNLLRRHLNREMKRAVIADELRENPNRSNNSIGKLLGVSDNTVHSVREEEGLDSTERVGDDGKTYKGGAQRKSHYVQRVAFATREDLEVFRTYVRECKKLTGELNTGAALIARLKLDAD